jgi:hypothetical protein
VEAAGARRRPVLRPGLDIAAAGTAAAEGTGKGTMRKPALAWAALICGAAAAVVIGCDDDAPSRPPDSLPDSVMADFTLTDLNPNSPTYNQDVSPRQLRGRVSAWYFGAAT